MTNKEKYKEAFSTLQTSRNISLEVENMAVMKRKHKMNLAVAAAAACIIIGGSATAYAADVGGVQEKFSAWINGMNVHITVKDTEDKYGCVFSYKDQDGEEHTMGGGGVSIDENGSETIMTAQAVMAEYSDKPQVDTDDAGHVWIYLREKSADITDLFDGDGICRVAVTSEDVTYYVKITRDGDGSYPYESSSNAPKEGAELYTQINGESRIHTD